MKPMGFAPTVSAFGERPRLRRDAEAREAVQQCSVSR
jgi:hypothetical protein